LSRLAFNQIFGYFQLVDERLVVIGKELEDRVQKQVDHHMQNFGDRIVEFESILQV
jgi:hypothetical protein